MTHFDADANQDQRQPHAHAEDDATAHRQTAGQEPQPQSQTAEPPGAVPVSVPPPWRRSRQRGLTTRDLLAIALDGKAPTGDDDASVGYHTAGKILAPQLRRLQADIGLPARALFTVIDGRFDHLDRVLIASGFIEDPATAAPPSGPRPLTMPPVLMVGSDPRPSTDVVIRRQLSRGGLVVTSDRSALLPTFATLGVRTRASAVTHVRASRCVDATSGDMPRLADDRLLPALRLSAGHRALVGAARPEAAARVLVCEVQTREPLVVLWQAGGGFLLHSVAHWWQNETPDRTLLGSRALRRIPDFRSVADIDARWGEFQAGYCLLSCLLFAMRASLTRQGSDEGWRAAA